MRRFVLLLVPLLFLTSCEYVRLLRPSVLKQLNPRVVRLINELPEVDQPNEEMIGRLFAHGGLGHAEGFAPELIGAPRGTSLYVFALP